MGVGQPHHVVILGCGRSGTSIFGELFEHLSAYTYLSEPVFGEYLESDFNRPMATKVPAEDAKFESVPGLSFPLERLLADVPGPIRFYWIVRHPLDAICSLRPGIANNWGHHPRPPDWQDWLSRPLLERCAHHWNYLNSVGYSAIAYLATVKRFEDMIRNPRVFANGIGEEVGLKAPENNDELSQWAQRVQDTNNEHFVEAKTSRNYSRPDHTKRVSRWTENLTPGEVEALTPIVLQTARQFGYDLEASSHRIRGFQP